MPLSVDYQSKHVLVLQVPVSSQIHRCNGIIYDRGHEGDFRVTDPTLSKFFMQMGRGEELGSGVLNVSKYLPLYAKGAKPQFVEGNPFVTVIPLPAETGAKSSGKGEEKSREKSEEKSREKNRDRILKMIRKKPTVTTQKMMDSLGLSRAGVEKIVKKLKQERRISRVGPDKGGHWEVMKDQQP